MDAPGQPAPTAAVEACLTAGGAAWRRVADGEWGLRTETGDGWPLDIGLALRGGLLRVQAEVLPPGRADAHELLYRNRRTELVRISHTSEGAVWLQGELPQDGLTEAAVDRLLGGLLLLAGDLRAGHPG